MIRKGISFTWVVPKIVFGLLGLIYTLYICHKLIRSVDVFITFFRLDTSSGGFEHPTRAGSAGRALRTLKDKTSTFAWRLGIWDLLYGAQQKR